MIGLWHVGAGVVAVFLTWAVVRLTRVWALRKGVLDRPNERSLHVVPTPRGGGVGIALVVTVLSLSSFALFPEFLGHRISILAIGLVFSGALLITVVSWLDDVHSGIHPFIRLMAHLSAALLVVFGLGGWTLVEMPFLGSVSLSWIGPLAAAIWIVWLTNAYNFMDGIDGIAGIQALTAAGGWLAVGLLSRDVALSFVGTLIGCSVIGFLFHNWPPAKIFLGDTGSAFLGFSFAVIPVCADKLLVSSPAARRFPVAGLLMVAPFIVDATFTLIRRLINGERLSQAHRSHLYQRLVISGLSHRTVSLLYLGLGLVGSSAGVAFLFVRRKVVADAFAPASLVIILLVPLIWAACRESRAA